MEDNQTEAFATRLQATEAESVQDAVDEMEATRAWLIRRAVRFYVTENPDNLAAFAPNDFTSQMIAELD